MTRGRDPLVTIDARGYFTGGGIGRYTKNLVREILSADSPGVAVRLLISNQHRPSDLDLSERPGVDVVVSRATWMDATEEARWLEEETAGSDLFHSLTGHWLAKETPSVATLHDLTPVVRPRLVGPEARKLGQSLADSMLSASHVIAVSEATAQDARLVFGGRMPPVTVIHEAAAPAFHPGVPAGNVLCRYSLIGRGFFLAVSVLNRHKNMARLVDAYAAAGIAAPLVIIGAHRGATTHVQDAIARNRVAAQVRMIGHVTDEDLAALYASCRAFVYPSLYEGFGLPVVEAMACGAAVIASNASSIPEVAGQAALLVDPTRTALLASAMRRIDADETLRLDLRKRAIAQAGTFSWAQTAASTLAVYRNALSARVAA